jgi:hypothetical protein
MTDNPTADKARLREIAERANMVVGKLGLCSTAEAYSIIEHELPWLLSQLTAALTAALAAEKERDELLKHCTALERESFENLIEHEKWQEREAVYKSQIEAGAKRIEAAEKALEPFAKAAEYVTEEFSDLDSTEFALLDEQQPTVGDLRRAARALSAAGGQ